MTRLRPAIAALLLAVAALGGCAVWLPPPQTQALLQQTPAGLPPAVELEAVPFFPQTPYHCGPAALATVLGHAGLPADPQALAEAVFLPSREGSLQVEMLAGARRQGALATRLPGELAALLHEVAAGRPVLVLQNLGLALAPVWHYAVLVGYDLGAAEVVLRSGVTRRERLPLHFFERSWARAGHWAVVVLPPGDWPGTATPAAALEAAVGFERTAGPAAAVLVYRSLWQRWPEQALAGIGLGNSLAATGELAAAATFEQVALQHDSAVAWNNLARLRLALGQMPAAREAARRALARAAQAEPAWLPAAQATQQALDASDGPPQPAAPPQQPAPAR